MDFLKKYNLPDPVCMYKWTWSTIRLMEASTNSCHRVKSSNLTPETYENFHNTPLKLEHRKKMLSGLWPGDGCEYCRDLERAGALSDRLDLNKDIHLTPPELEENPKAINVTPRMVEVYFNNLCNLGCIYCSATYSTVWEYEEEKFGLADETRLKQLKQSREQYPAMLAAHWKWLEKNAHEINYYGVLGGEPFFQPELEQNIEFFEKNPCPNLKFYIFSNLKVNNTKFRSILDRLTNLVESNHIDDMRIVCSLDCWGPQQEYIRTGLNLKNWEKNFLTLLHDYPLLHINIHSTIISLTMQTLPQLCSKISEWRKVRHIHHTLSFVSSRPEMDLGNFPKNYFKDDFDKAIEYTTDPKVKSRLEGFRKKIDAQKPDFNDIKKLKNTLDIFDQRRGGTSWRTLWPWLDKYEV